MRHIQNDLFDVGADLCRPERPGAEKPSLRITEEQVTWLENQIDRFNAELEPLNSFVLPGGSPASAHLHHARTVTRRAERDVVRLSADEPVNAAVLRYVNRLSDLLFVLARFLNDKGKEDVRWQARPASLIFLPAADDVSQHVVLESRVNNVHESVAVEDPFAPDRIEVREGFGGDGFFE